jgi:ATP-dependent DNA helicase RecQ
MVHFAECSACRRRELLRYFGEDWPADNCSGCDNCLSPRDTFDGTVAAQKFLSCLYRVRQKTGFNFGLNHIVEVLTGAQTELIRKWRHDEVSVYGVGREMKRGEWQAIGRELVRLGLVRQSAEKFTTLELTGEGLAALKQRQQITLTRPTTGPEKPVRAKRGAIECDETLFERLRALRRRLADERDVPAYIVFSDVTLREMARACPTTTMEFSELPGVGQQKLKDYAAPFIAEITAFLADQPPRKRHTNVLL